MPTVPFLMKQTRSVKLFTKIPTQFILPLRLLLCDKSDDFYSDLTPPPPFFLRQKSRARKCSNCQSRSLRCLSSKMDDSGSDGCMTQRQYDIIVLFLYQGYFPTKRELMEAHFANGEDTIRPRPFRKFKSWTQRLLYRESENALIHLPTGKIVIPKERFVEIIVANHCNETGGHLTAYATMRKVRVKFMITEQFCVLYWSRLNASCSFASVYCKQLWD